MRSPLAQPATDHAGLREGEREKDADGIERNECVGVAAEYDNEKQEKTPRMMMPLENTRRSPMSSIWWGM